MWHTSLMTKFFSFKAFFTICKRTPFVEYMSVRPSLLWPSINDQPFVWFFVKFGLDLRYKMAQSKGGFHENRHIEGSTRLIQVHEVTVTRVQWNCMMLWSVPLTELQKTEINVVAGRFRLIQVRRIQIVGLLLVRNVNFSAKDSFTLCPGFVWYRFHCIWT